MDSVRNIRIRRIVKKLNRQRKVQARKIDLLCGDFVKLNRNFLEQLKNQELIISYYEKILRQPNLETLLDTTAEFIQDYITVTNVAIHVQGSFKSHICDSAALNNYDGHELEKCFTTDIVCHITGSYKCISLEQMLEAGLAAGPMQIKNITATAIPFAQPNTMQGFVLVYRDAATPFTHAQIKKICSIVPALSKAAQTFAAEPATSN